MAATVYPASLDSYSTKVNNVDIYDASHINDLQGAVVAVETELGTAPKGTSASVKERLAGIRSKSGATADTLVVDGANVGVGTLTPGSLFSIGGANGQQLGFHALTEEATIAAAASADTAIQIPANAVVFAVSVRVTTVIPTAATFTVTGAGSATAFNTAAVNVAAGSTDAGTKSCPYFNATAQKIRITPNLTPATATGKVRVTIYYYISTPPTS